MLDLLLDSRRIDQKNCVLRKVLNTHGNTICHPLAICFSVQEFAGGLKRMAIVWNAPIGEYFPG